LSSDNEDERSGAQAEIVSLAEESSENRRAVINKLLLTAEEYIEEDQLVLDPDVFRFWWGASQIFYRLQATEAIDVLIRYIYCGSGLYGINYYEPPAPGALVRMGLSAVPKLSEALLHNDNSRIRRSVALCLGGIGVAEAKQALEEALQSETDRDVIHHIELALGTIVRGSR